MFDTFLYQNWQRLVHLNLLLLRIKRKTTQHTVKTLKLIPVSLISSSCMFRLANSVRLPTLDSFIFHPLTSNLLVRRAFFCQAPLLWNNLSCFLRKTMEGEFLPKNLLDLPSRPTFSPLDSKCFVCVRAVVCHWFRACVCVWGVRGERGNDEKYVE